MKDVLKMAPQQCDLLKPLFSAPSNNSSSHKYPEGKEFAVCLVHDVGIISPSLPNIFYYCYRHMKKGSIKNGFKMLFSRFSRQFNPFFNFEKLIELERKYGATSGFYFSALNKGEKGYNYNISDLACELKNIRENGWEVGFLGSSASLFDLEDIVSRKMKLKDVLRDKVVGYVDPFNSLNNPENWIILYQAVFEYMAAFVDPVNHFGESVCYPFRAYDPEIKDVDITVLPLNVIDCNASESFAHANLNDADIENTWESIKKIIDYVSECSGILTLRFPSEAMIGNGLFFYERILSYCSKKNVWMTSGKEITDWWRSFHT